MTTVRQLAPVGQDAALDALRRMVTLALIAITVDPTSDRTLIAITITPN